VEAERFVVWVCLAVVFSSWESCGTRLPDAS
jgi:hypothetical protein